MNDELHEQHDDGAAPEEAATTEPGFRELIDKLHAEHGFDFRDYKQTSLERRIRRRMSQVHVDSYPSYITFLDRNPQEHIDLIDVILINVTRFFRDGDAWQSLAQQVLPRLIEDSGTARTLRVWSAGCSSGEEPYTIAMLIADHIKGDGAQ